MGIEITNLSKKFGSFTALKDVSFKVPAGELIGLLGPSGSGKTTLLRLIAGLEAPDSGSVYFYGEDMNGRAVGERGVGFVFQHYALFRHMSVFDNVAFGMTVKPSRFRPSKAEIGKKVHELLELVKLDSMSDRLPSQLSGGQRQRVALARALAVEPKVLLLDEPFGALDAKVRRELRKWLRRLHDEIHITSIFVTHDQEEALELADRVVVINEGRVEQIATPDEVYSRPANSFVYKFIGEVTRVNATVSRGRAFMGNIPLELPPDAAPHDGPATVLLRPHMLEIARVPDWKPNFPAAIRQINCVGAIVKMEVETDWKQTIGVELSRERYQDLELKKNERVFISPLEKNVFVEIQSNGHPDGAGFQACFPPEGSSLPYPEGARWSP